MMRPSVPARPEPQSAGRCRSPPDRDQAFACIHGYRAHGRFAEVLGNFEHQTVAPRLMPPAYVKPYMKRHKNDAVDAEAICEAVTRANMFASSPGSASP